MNILERTKSDVEYGRKLVDSGLAGARSGREEFLHGQPLTPFLGKSARKAVIPAAIGACIGLLARCPGRQPKSVGGVLASAIFGGAIGFGAGIAWESRRLTRSVASSALKNIGKVRDEHWLEKNPIDYA